MNDLEVAKIIYQQLGGNRFSVITGSKLFAAIENGLSFKLARNSSSANYCRVILGGDDLYKVEFVRATVKGIKTVKEFSGIYFDQLCSIFEKTTGLYTSL